MKIIIYFLIAFTILSCFSESEKKQDLKKNEREAFKKKHHRLNQTGIILVKIDNNLLLNWDNKTGNIVKDKLFNNISLNFKEHSSTIFVNLTNIKTTSAVSCGKNTNLVVGDICYLLIDEIKNLPTYEILNAQYDTFNDGCKYPVGLFDAIQKNREKIKSRVIKFLKFK